MKKYEINPNPQARITFDKDDLLLIRDSIGVARQCDDMYRGWSSKEMDGLFTFVCEVLEDMK